MKCTSNSVNLFAVAAMLLIGCSSTPSADSADAAADSGTPDKAQGPLSIETLEGSAWTLRQYGLDGPKVEGATVTLGFNEGQISGFAGCNQYRGSIEAGPEPGKFQLGPVATTKRLCAGPLMEIENEYLAALRSASHLELNAGSLLIAYDDDGESGVMLFDADEEQAKLAED